MTVPAPSSPALATPARSRPAREAAELLSRRLEQERFRGWDPYDALSSPLLRAAARTRLLRRAAIQAVKRSPVNLRPLLGIPKREHTKALAVLTSAYVKLARAGHASAAATALELRDRLVERAVPSGDGAGWGYDFDVQTRWGYYRAGHPNAVATAFSAHALLDTLALTPRADIRDLADAALKFASTRLIVERDDGRFFAYFEGSSTPIHNANLLVASLFARAGNDEQRQRARGAVYYTLERQRPDGAWPYGEARNLGWVDGFHTAYVLERLADWARREDEPAIRTALVRGTALYVSRLIDPDGAPRASLESRLPIDIHAASSAVTALSQLRAYDERALPTAERVLDWTLANMRRDDGRFCFQRRRRRRICTPYVRWSDAHMLLALATYLVNAQVADV